MLLACGNDDNGLTGGPGQLTGPCIQGQCLPGLQCFIDECLPGAGGNSNSNSNGNSDGEPDPTGTGGTGGASEGVTQGSMTAASGESATTGEPSPTSTSTTTGDAQTTQRPESTETFGSSDSDSRGFIASDTDTSDSDSRGFIEPGDCGFDTCDADETCVQVGREPTCLPHCDPLAKPACAPDYMCAPQEDVFVCAPDSSGDVGAIGDACAYANACDPGNVCLANQFLVNCAGQACCSTFCDLDLADPCGQYGLVCISWYEQGQAPSGYEDVGVCAAG